MCDEPFRQPCGSPGADGLAQLASSEKLCRLSAPFPQRMMAGDLVVTPGIRTRNGWCKR